MATWTKLGISIDRAARPNVSGGPDTSGRTLAHGMCDVFHKIYCVFIQYMSRFSDLQATSLPLSFKGN